jgi:hypothetical protein
LKYKGNTSNRGIITHQVDGVPLGDSLDQYSSAQTYPELSLGVFTFTNDGNHTVRQTVIGKNPAGTGSRWASADKFTLTLFSPAITSVTPTNGSTAGGTLVTIAGSNFVSGLSVFFGASNAASVNFSNAALVTAIAPSHSSGAVDVTVQNPGGQSAILSNAFMFQTPPPIIETIAQLGANVILTGTNGPAYGTYFVLGSTNVSLPLSNWSRLATNSFDADGSFNFTNAIPSEPQQYYLLQLPSF